MHKGSVGMKSEVLFKHHSAEVINNHCVDVCSLKEMLIFQTSHSCSIIPEQRSKKHTQLSYSSGLVNVNCRHFLPVQPSTEQTSKTQTWRS